MPDYLPASFIKSEKAIQTRKELGMDNSARSTNALMDRANAGVAQLLRRFETILALAPDTHNPKTTAVEAYQMEVETQALVRAAEDLTALTRQLKEAWLFGELDTLGPSEAEKKTDEDARAVAQKLEKLIDST